jgi:hypothetical protein
LTVIVTVAMFEDDGKAIVEGLRLQALYAGRCEHELAVSALDDNGLA